MDPPFTKLHCNDKGACRGSLRGIEFELKFGNDAAILDTVNYNTQHFTLEIFVGALQKLPLKSWRRVLPPSSIGNVVSNLIFFTSILIYMGNGDPPTPIAP